MDRKRLYGAEYLLAILATALAILAARLAVLAARLTILTILAGVSNSSVFRISSLRVVVSCL